MRQRRVGANARPACRLLPRPRQPAEHELQGAGQLAWLNRLEVRHRNLSEALSWLAEGDQLTPALHLIWATWRFWWLHGHAEELARYAERILARSDEMPPQERALALSGTGFTLLIGADQSRAESLFEQSLALYRQAQDTLGAAMAAVALGHLLALRHEQVRGRELLEQTRGELEQAARAQLDGAQRLQHLLDVTLAENFLGQIYLGQGDHDRAARHFTDGLTAARGAQDRFTILVSLYDLALSSQVGGDLTAAAARLKEGLALAVEAGDEPSLAYYLEALADVAAQQDDPLRAVGLLTAADALLQASGSGWLHAYVPRAPHDDFALAALRARTTDAAFRQARARGRSLTAASAVRYGLEEAGSRRPGKTCRALLADATIRL